MAHAPAPGRSLSIRFAAKPVPPLLPNYTFPRLHHLLARQTAKLLDLPILYLSRHINQHRADYYRLLLEVTTTGAWEPWLLYMMRGVEETSEWTIRKIAAVREFYLS